MEKRTITFDTSAKEAILDIFDKTVDSDGFIVEKNDSKQRALSPSGEEIEAEKLAAIKKGSLLFFKSDLPSLIELADRLKNIK